jgi:hypothetical protein
MGQRSGDASSSGVVAVAMLPLRQLGSRRGRLMSLGPERERVVDALLRGRLGETS